MYTLLCAFSLITVTVLVCPTYPLVSFIVIIPFINPVVFAPGVIPDLFVKREVQALVNVLLVDVGFKALCLHQEAVCAAFGSGASLSCFQSLF